MLLLIAVALLVFVFGTFTGNRESSNMIIIQQVEDLMPFDKWTPSSSGTVMRRGDTVSGNQFQRHAHHHHLPLETASRIVHGNVLSSVHHPFEKFAFLPPPANPKRIGPQSCPVCYLPVKKAAASMPSLPSASPVIHNLTYLLDENPIRTEPYGGSEFGGYPSLKQRIDSFDIKESMTVHCGFVKGSKPGYHTGFNIYEADLMELEQFHEVIVASAIFGIHKPRTFSDVFHLLFVLFYFFSWMLL